MKVSVPTLSTQPNFNKLDGIETYLCGRVIGQSHVMPQIAQLVRRAEMGQTRSWEPLCRMLFVGSTGVGKTLTAKAISQYVLGPDAYHQLDMSEFMLKESVENFIGDKSGDLGRLGRILDLPGKKLLLFDEIEKAHAEIMNLFLQMLEEGHITVGRGTKFTLNNCYIIVTTNIGSDKIIKADSEYTNHAILEQVCMAEFGKKYGTEKIQRFQAFCVFVKLSQADQLKIARLELEAEIEHQHKLGNRLDFDQSAIDFLYNVGCSELYGARPLRNQTALHVRNTVTSLILKKRTGTVSGRLVANLEQTQLLLST
jgi:ATP-dependent Clp protease ATP-binding subunit ClpB